MGKKRGRRGRKKERKKDKKDKKDRAQRKKKKKLLSKMDPQKDVMAVLGGRAFQWI
jgi:hypothetical protein